MMEYIIVAVVLAVAVGAYFYMKRKEEPEAEKFPWEMPKPKRPNEPPPSAQPEPRLTENGEPEGYSAPIVQDGGWPIDVEEEFGVALDERPADGIPGWEVIKTRVAFLPYTIVHWRDPENGLVRWVDYNPQKPDAWDWYYIASGARDVTATNWNGLWINEEKINSRRDEEGLQRVRDYKGGLRSDPNHWPEPYKTAYLESH